LLRVEGSASKNTYFFPKRELYGAELLPSLIVEISGTNAFEGLLLMRLHRCTFIDPTLNIFVANRVAAIQVLTVSVEWRYFPTSLNPADILSRGAFPTVLNGLIDLHRRGLNITLARSNRFHLSLTSLGFKEWMADRGIRR